MFWIKLRFSSSSSSARSRWQNGVARLTACRQSRFAIWHCCSSIYGPGGCWERQTDRHVERWLDEARECLWYSPATCPNMPLQLLTIKLDMLKNLCANTCNGRCAVAIFFSEFGLWDIFPCPTHYRASSVKGRMNDRASYVLSYGQPLA